MMIDVYGSTLYHMFSDQMGEEGVERIPLWPIFKGFRLHLLKSRGLSMNELIWQMSRQEKLYI